MASCQKSSYVSYEDPKVEPSIDNEESLIDKLIAVGRRTQEHNFSMHRHYMRITHVKTQGIVKGELTIAPNLPDELAQGIASNENASRSHPIAIRYANEPSWLQDDRAPGPRGCSMRIFDVVAGDDDAGWLDSIGARTKTQDMTFNNAPQLELRDLPTALEIFQIRERNFLHPDKIPEEIKKVRDDADLQLASASLPNHHFLAYTMYSQSAYRWGPYVAKYALFPADDTQRQLGEKGDKVIDDHSNPDQHSKWLREYFTGAQDDSASQENARSQAAIYDLRVQLCENIDEQPVEDCGVEWDEEKYPFRTIARVVIPANGGEQSVKQDPFDPARRTFWDDHMKLNVWHGLKAHQPLGSVNRLRRRLYEASAQARSKGNSVKIKEVGSINEIP